MAGTKDRRLQILGIIEKNPGIRFNEVMRISDMKNGTLSHYVKKLEEENHIKLERTPRVTRLYPLGIPEEEAEICKFLNTPTQKKIILFILEKEIVTSIQIREYIKKSPSVVSVNLSELFKAKIINRKYDIPSNIYSIKKPELVRCVLNEYYPNIIEKLSTNSIETLDF